MRVWLGLALAAMVWGAQAQQQSVQGQNAPAQLGRRDQVTTIQAHARAVMIDVVVTDGHGHAVHDLKPEDFQVLENGEQQTIRSFEEIRPPSVALAAAAEAAAKLPVNTFTNGNKIKSEGAMTVLLIDGLDTRLEYQAYAHSQLISYLNSAKIEGPIAIFALDTQLRQIQGFTTDVEVLKRAVKERDKLIQTVYPHTGGYVVQRFKTEILTHAMSDLGRYLADFPGRKNLIWFTGGVPQYSYDDGTYVGGALHDSESFTANYGPATDLLTLGRVSIYPIDAEGLRTNPAFSAAQRGVPSIGQISGFSVGQGLKHEDLEDVAAATGGKAFYNTNGIKQAIAEVVETGANYYTLTYSPTNKDWDGKYRKLKVMTDVDGARLEYRQGYYARTDVGPLPGTQAPKATLPHGRQQLTSHQAPDPFAQAMQLGAIDPGTIVFQAKVQAPQAVEQIAKGAPLPAEVYLEPKYANKPYRQMLVTYTVDAKQLRLTSNAEGLRQGSVEFVLVVTDDKGALVNSHEATVEMNVQPATYDYMLTNGVQLPMKIAVPEKGNYFLRAGVRDVASGKVGALEVPVGEIVIGK